MKVKKLEQSARRNILVLLLFGLVICGLLGGLLYRNDINNRLDSVAIEQQRKIAQAEVLWGQNIGDIRNTIRILFRSPAFTYALASKTPPNSDLIKRIFTSFVESVDPLMQVRWLDENGIEKVRVDIKNGKVIVAEENVLQDKSRRYYVEQGMKAGDGKIYLSNVDLNVENGKIEVPFRPTIRATIKTGPTHGLHTGLLVLNYDVGGLLEVIRSFDSDRVNLQLIDTDGYWLKNVDPKLEWGRDLKETTHSIAAHNPDIWSQINRQKSFSRFNHSLGFASYECSNLTGNLLSEDIVRSPSLCFVATTSVSVLNKLKIDALIPSLALCATIVLFGIFILKREWNLKMELIRLYRVQERDKKQIEESASYNRNLLNQQQLLQNDLVESRKLSALGMMVAGVAHELNTPIGTAILAASRLRAEHKRLTQAVEEGLSRSALDQYLISTETGLELVENSQKKAATLIRSFKRLAIDRVSEDVISYRLDVVVGDLLATLSPRFKESQIEYDIQVDPIEMVGRPGSVSHVLQNLLVNAMQHAFKKEIGGKISVSAKLCSNEREVEICVSDNGKGIAPDVLSNLFDPFVTTNRAEGNTGLGMHFVHQWVTSSLNGSIKVESELQKGTTFIIKLPKHYKEEQEANPASS
ncbi:HAMP domain-containing sensor histidine kinase [Vibrio plantisponsor]|uniref:histidine kinase n=1 Tax=Vibrio plantisponsor TaxID=664643 RepID=A0ABU4IHW2_9VIBR|nr:HAMP domain-containing sensor histidine kinase [Vibrio plantisponsor]MDW6016859.1 HAMP domain-containing sensor histidine kinase [Vibrio plantisponsor]NNM42596.1 HAMP domain-containing histidine kinase [Vibrio plantisponsor]